MLRALIRSPAPPVVSAGSLGRVVERLVEVSDAHREPRAMTDIPHWADEARRRIDAGERVLDVARDLGVDDRHLRIKLNLNGEADKRQIRDARSRGREEPEWVAQARVLIAAGGSVIDVARHLGKSADGVRYALDLNGAKEKQKARVRGSRERERAERVGMRPRATGKRPAQAISEERSAANSYADPKPARPLTLPKISLPDIEEPRLIRIAPRSVATVNPGVERWREAHQRMLRRGLIADHSDLIHRLSH